MSKSVRVATTHLRVIDSHGARTVLTVSTPVVTETTLDGDTVTYEKLATILNARGQHVKRKSETEFESLDGDKYTLIA